MGLEGRLCGGIVDVDDVFRYLGVLVVLQADQELKQKVGCLHELVIMEVLALLL